MDRGRTPSGLEGPVEIGDRLAVTAGAELERPQVRPGSGELGIEYRGTIEVALRQGRGGSRDSQARPRRLKQEQIPASVRCRR